ncbi:Putative auto-transporter adhesin, head GIN domain [Pseudonocardia thermophila]|uniref:Putative auto-transporter adhesin, head GIN domain n=1 Tax=Pseudonocardia thermophila TaxID=1848 RepID=A0A1M6R424_PSETH|nr:Putative auto-transporter adhesin, head GIN domain [Pseudonocardia thermophila]
MPNAASGAGEVTSEQRTISDVTGIDLATSGTVDVSTGPPSLTVEAPADLLPLLTSEVSGGTLVLSVEDRAVLRGASRIHYTVTVPSLERIVISGAGTVRHPDIRGSSLTVDIEGSGDVVVGGSVDEQVVSVHGSGSYEAAGLATKITEIRISGSGEADVTVSDSLTVDVSGSGDVTYRGSPKVQQHISGTGEVTQAR